MIMISHLSHGGDLKFISDNLIKDFELHNH